MEELRTTEALDREILEDARKKAQKILKTADETLKIQSRDWDKKISDAIVSIKNSYGEKQKKDGEEIFARLPLDKRRLRSETSEKFLIKAMNDFLRSLKRETLLSVLRYELLERIKAACESGAVEVDPRPEVLYSAVSQSEVRELLRGISGAEEWNFLEDPIPHEFPSVAVTTQTAKISASVETSAAALLKDKRAELAAALLGEEVLND